jgi:hypothetical protein
MTVVGNDGVVGFLFHSIGMGFYKSQTCEVAGVRGSSSLLFAVTPSVLLFYKPMVFEMSSQEIDTSTFQKS